MPSPLPRIVIVGAGFGGLAAAKALRKTNARVVLVDRQNHHLFQPLLYQVATSVLTPGQIASPIRAILRGQENTTVVLGEVTGVDKERKRVFVDSADREGVPIPYDYLILATGASHSYSGHDEFAKHAPGLKSLADAVAIRNKILQAFEQAEAEEDPGAHRDLLTFVLVGAGPAGVEMAGAIAALVRNTLRSEFLRIDPTSARIVLVHRANRGLSPYSEDLSRAAKERLEKLGVEVRLGHSVDQIDEDGVTVAGERTASKTVIWTAGVAPSPAGKWLKVETDRAGRVRVQPDLTVHAASRLPPSAGGADRSPVGAHRADPSRGRPRPRRPARSHDRQDQQPRRSPADRGTVRGQPGRRGHPAHRPRHLLPASRRARPGRPHPRDLDHRPLSRARTCLLFLQRRKPGIPARLRRPHAAQSRSARGDCLPRARAGAAGADHGDPRDPARRHREVPGASGRWRLAPGRRPERRRAALPGAPLRAGGALIATRPPPSSSRAVRWMPSPAARRPARAGS